MATRKPRATTGPYRRRRENCVLHDRNTGSLQFLWIIVSCLLATAVFAPAFAQNETCTVDGTTANCSDVPPDGISYPAGITEVNVDDGEAGVTDVTPGNLGIGLYLYGSTGDTDIDTEYVTILWDTDGDENTDPVSVVSGNGLNPLLVSGEYIFDNGGDPQTFTIGSATYTGDELAEFLADPSVGAGGMVTGFLTVNNEAPFATTDAGGILAASQGGQGGGGGCWTILLIYTHCSDGSNGGSAGSVAVNNNAAITVNGITAGAHGITAVSQGGHGGKGGGAIGLFANAGEGGDGGAGGDVAVMLGTESAITTNSPESHGVFALSRGGNGGAAGWAYGAFSFGDSGGNGGDAGTVQVENAGTITTTGWNSHGIYARSEGAGAGSGSSSGGIYAEGGNGGGESDGGMVTVHNSGTITTQNSDSYGILAQSIGGGGGDGGGAGGWFTVGGRGGSGGNSDIVSVFDSGAVQTSGDRSTAIFAQSIGGGGGNGGDAVSFSQLLSVAIGGNGGLGGDGDEVHVSTDGSDIDTSGDDAHGIHAQSIGGGGGNGGLAIAGTYQSILPVNVSVALGGAGGTGGDAGEVVSISTSSDTTIDTAGARSHGIVAQSIGGGGGNGGTSLSGSVGGGISVAVAIGGSGGAAGDASNVDVGNAATITTTGDLSSGIFTQSIGGGGGSGGFSGSLAAGGGAVSVSLGGDGSTGGVGGQIDVDNSGTITTGGEGAAGIFAQSIGGSGGNGGSALAVSAGLGSVSTTIGGKGGAGNDGDLVDILNSGLITTLGNNSAGIFAQSIGGGGGSGGDSISLAVGAVAVTVAVGGDGGNGGTGGDVIVGNTGRIETGGITSDGVFAQSIGGSGGSGGSATTGTIVFPIEIQDVEIPAISANVAVGGNGAGGGTAGTVTVANTGVIETSNFMSNGVFAQSVGGSGGRGGHATNISISYDATFTGKVSVGGAGGLGGAGNTVTVGNAGLIHTLGDFSSGVFAQSIGGGGGFGGNATNVSLSLTPPPTAPSDFIPTPSVDFDLAIGGNGGAGSDGGDVGVTNTGTIITEGHFATGVMAQSVGGSGGSGGDARVISVELTADPLDFMPLMDLTGLDVSLAFGGTGAAGGDGGDVIVNNISDLGTIGIQTSGAFAHGIVAQSVGGGGGNGGAAMTFEFSNADIVPDIPILDDISGLTSIEMTLQGNGGPGGDGGNVTLNSAGNILTQGHFAMGIVAQSVAGGGGLAGFFNPHGITNNEIADAVFNTFIDTDAGLSFAGSVGGAGTAGNVLVHHTGDIQTLGVAAHGLFAQSAAGLGIAGDVDVTLDGSIFTFGEHSAGIYAQSGGGAGNGDIDVTINGGIVAGGSGMGAGLYISGGNNNSVWSDGLITSVSGIDGYAIRATGGHDFIENHGVMTGSVNLGAGANYFANHGLVNAGAFYFVGPNNLLLNEGVFSPGGTLNVLATSLTGDFEQTEAGTLWYDLQFNYGLDTADRLDISGKSWFDGSLALFLSNPGKVLPGQHQFVLISSSGGIEQWDLDLITAPSAVIAYSLMGLGASDYTLNYNIDFAPDGLTNNQAALGEHINDIQLAGGSALMEPLTASIVAIPDVPTLAAAYSVLSPHVYSANQLSRLFTSLDFEQSMHSCPVREGDLRFSREGECSWVRLSDRSINYSANDDSLAATDKSLLINMGTQWALTPHWHGGIALGVEESNYDVPLALERDGTQVQIGGIFKGRYGGNAIDLSMAFGSGHYDTKRVIGPPDQGNAATGKRELQYAAAHTGYAYMFDYGNWFVQPGVDLGWTSISGSGLHESGAGAAALYIRPTDEKFITSRLDLLLGAEIQSGNKRVYRPFLRTSYTHILAGTSGEIEAKLTGAPEGVPYFTQVIPFDDNLTNVTLGLDMFVGEKWVMRLSYDRQFATDWDTDSFFAKVMYEM